MNIYCRHTNFGAGSEYDQEMAHKHLGDGRWHKVVKIKKYSFGIDAYIENLPDVSFNADMLTFAAEREDGKTYVYDMKQDPNKYLATGTYLA